MNGKGGVSSSCVRTRCVFPATALQTQCRHQLNYAQAEEENAPKFFVVNGMPSTITDSPIQERKLRQAASDGDLLSGLSDGLGYWSAARWPLQRPIRLGAAKWLKAALHTSRRGSAVHCCRIVFMRIVRKHAGSRAGRAWFGAGLFRLKHCFAARSPLLLIVIGLLTVILVGLIDFVTGAEISLSIFYLFPIAFTTWFAGRMPGLFTAVLSAGIWLVADLSNALMYSHPAIPFWNSAVRLGIFVLMACQLSSIRRLTGNLEQAVQKKTALLNTEIQSRKELEREITELTSRQRRDIAYELHDGLCPLLGGIALKAKILQDILANQDSAEAHSAGELVSLLKTANQQTRLLARGLDPIAVELHGLIPALGKLAADTEELFRVGCTFKTDLESAPVSPSAAFQLYRIAQEAIHNAVAHGRAERIKLELLIGASHPDCGRTPSAAASSVESMEKFEHGSTARAAVNRDGSPSNHAEFHLTITDDGNGFVRDRVPAGGMGMRIMRFRAECIGAALRVESRPNLGTTVECYLTADHG
jgi:signal transduction histidine kinase